MGKWKGVVPGQKDWRQDRGDQLHNAYLLAHPDGKN